MHPYLLTGIIRLAATDPQLADLRIKLARDTAHTFETLGNELHVVGHIIGSDRVMGASPWGHGTDETVAVSMILRIGSQLTSASTDLLADGRIYAASALIRQIVEVEYLAWAFDARDGSGEKWLRSSRRERESFFSPSKLRQAAAGKFRGVDYSYHCEFGGHPVPSSTMLLRNDESGLPQFLLSDLLGHAGRIWDHVVGWAQKSSHGEPVVGRNPEMLKRFVAWKELDPLANLPPPTAPKE
jgi:hypothetical protein